MAYVADKLKPILRLSRLKFLLGGIVANTFGGTLALYDAGKLNLALLLAGQLIITLTQLMGQYQNEYWDIETDKLATQRSFSGGTDVLAKGALSKRSVMILSLSLLFTAFSAVIFLSLALSARPYLITIFLLAAFLSWSYSSPPARLLSTGFGEVAVTVVLAFLVPVFEYYLQTGTTSPILLLCFPMFFFTLSMILSFSYPDYDPDKNSGKHTILVRLGWRRTARINIAILALGYLSLGTSKFTVAPVSAIYLPLLTAPLALRILATLLKNKPTEKQLEDNSVHSAYLSLLIAVLLSSSLLTEGIFNVMLQS